MNQPESTRLYPWYLVPASATIPKGTTYIYVPQTDDESLENRNWMVYTSEYDIGSKDRVHSYYGSYFTSHPIRDEKEAFFPLAPVLSFPRQPGTELFNVREPRGYYDSPKTWDVAINVSDKSWNQGYSWMLIKVSALDEADEIDFAPDSFIKRCTWDEA